jgi:hypothetical protein
MISNAQGSNLTKGVADPCVLHESLAPGSRLPREESMEARIVRGLALSV